ncbi:Exodeoxyribonuclease 7 small subunit [Planctomycetes bacterium Pla163]|uniref:Exodeoxyribonuclease 7 small subunit n=1 Tax=Rohdeia mirabilis TaxID=2528008 RepID=A0A518D014_9BACT|nr:Exodeoxyribonuclease 7 small subunit [Planctomycetes bacterium Pla163]
MAAKRAAKKTPAGPGEANDRSGDDEVGFDERLDALETIVAELENGDLSLEDSIARYTNGIDLLKGCHQLLASHRRRVEELTRDAERSLAAFDEDPDFAADGGSTGGGSTGGESPRSGR